MQAEPEIRPCSEELAKWRLERRHDVLCRRFTLADPTAARNFVIGLCGALEESRQEGSVRFREEAVFVQLKIPHDGATEGLERLAKDLNDLSLK